MSARVPIRSLLSFFLVHMFRAHPGSYHYLFLLDNIPRCKSSEEAIFFQQFYTLAKTLTTGS